MKSVGGTGMTANMEENAFTSHSAGEATSISYSS
jgi:hypothetical protein